MKATSAGVGSRKDRRNKKQVDHAVVSPRSSLSTFYNPAVTTIVYGPPRHKTLLTENTSTGKLLPAKATGNQPYEINLDAIRENSVKESKKTWLLDNDTQNPRIRRNVSVQMFEKSKEVEVVDTDSVQIFSKLDIDSDDSTEQLDPSLLLIDPFVNPDQFSHSVESSDTLRISSVDDRQRKELLSVARLLDDFETSLSTAPFVRQSSVTSMSVAQSVQEKKESVQKKLKRLEVQRQSKSLTNLHRHRSARHRPNNPEKVVSADYVLLIESLRNEVLPYPVHTLTSQERSMVSHDESPALHSTRPLSSAHKNTDMPHTSSKEISSTTAAAFLESKDAEAAAEINGSERQREKAWRDIEDNVVSVRDSVVLALDLNNRSIGNQRAQSLAIALQFCPQLRSLKLQGNRLNDSSANMLMQQAFLYCPLEYLDISHNDLGKASAETLMCFIDPHIHKVKPCELQYLNISQCGLGDDLCGRIAAALARNDTIRELHAASNRIGSEDSKASLQWAECLQHNNTIQALNLSNNFLRNYAAQLLLKSLRVNRSLVYLDLAHNHVSDNDAVSCASFLETNTTLQTLDLSHNMIESRGCIALSYCLSQSNCINFSLLNLLGNKIGMRAYNFILDRMLFVVHQNHELHYVAHYQEANNRRWDATLQASKAPKTTPQNSSSADHTYEMDRMLNDDDMLPNGNPSSTFLKPSPATVETEPLLPVRIYRLLNILCQPLPDHDRVCPDPLDLLHPQQSLLDLSHPFERIYARIMLDILEANPCAVARELSWYNDVARVDERVSLERDESSRTEFARAVLQSHAKYATDAHRSLTNCTPRKLYQQDYDVSMLDNPFDDSHNLLTLLYQLVDLHSASSEVKATSTHLFAVRQLFAQVGQKLSLDFTQGILFFLLDRWHKFEYAHAHSHIEDVFAPWHEQLQHADNVQENARKIRTNSSKPSVYADIDSDKPAEKRDSLLRDVLLMLKFIVCGVFDFVLQRDADVGVPQLLRQKDLLLNLKPLTLQDIDLRPQKVTFAASMQALENNNSMGSATMTSLELAIRWLSEMTVQYNTHPLMDKRETSSSKPESSLQSAPSSMKFGRSESIKGSAEEDVTASYNTSLSICLANATQFLHYFLLLQMQTTMLCCPFNSATFKTVSFADFRSSLPTHGRLKFNVHVPEIQSSCNRTFTKEKHYLFNAWHKILCYNPTVHSSNNIILGKNCSDDIDLENNDKRFTNIPKMLSTWQTILDIDDNLLRLSCEQAELVLKLLCHSRQRAFLSTIQRLLLQISCCDDVRRFLTRNCYLHELIMLRQSMGALFGVLTGNVTAHYALDFRNGNDKLTAKRLLIWHNEQLYLMQHQLLKHKHIPGKIHHQDPNKRIPTPSVHSPEIDALFFRNASLNGASMSIDSEWLQSQLQGTGFLRFDYVCSMSLQDNLTQIMPASSLTYTNDNALKFFESNTLRDIGHVWRAETFRSSFNPLSFVAAGATAGKTPLRANDRAVDSVYNRIYSSCYHYVHHQVKRWAYDEKTLKVDSLKHEGFADWLIHQIFSGDAVKKSQRMCKKLKIPPKNSMIIESEEVDLRASFQRTQSAGLSSSQFPTPRQRDDNDKKQADVLNILARRSVQRVSAPMSTRSETPMMSSRRTPGTESARTTSQDSNDEDDNDDNDDDQDDYYSNDDDQFDDSDEECDYDKMSRQKRKELEKKGLSKQSYLNLQDKTSDLDSGSRRAFFLQKGLEVKTNIPTTESVPNNRPASPAKWYAAKSPQSPSQQPQANQLERDCDSVSVRIWKEFLDTSWTRYNACYHVALLTKAHALLQVMKKQYSGKYRFTYSFGSERDSFPDEMLNSKEFQQLSAERLHVSLPFDSEMQKTRRAKNGTIAFVTASLDALPQSKNTRKAFTSLPGSSADSVHSSSAPSTSKISPEQVSAVLKCVPFELNILLLETLLMYNMWINAKQLQAILEQFKSLQAPVSVFVRAISRAWKYVVDKCEVYHVVRECCNEEVVQECAHRLGMLIFWSPLHPEGHYDLELNDRQDRDVLTLLASLVLEDDTIEVECCQYQFSRLHPLRDVDIAQFALPQSPCSLTTRRSSAEVLAGSPSKGVPAASGTRDVTEQTVHPRVGRVVLHIVPRRPSGTSAPSTPGHRTDSIGTRSRASIQPGSPAGANRTLGLDAIAAQLAARRVYEHYRNTLLQHYLISPLAGDAIDSFHAVGGTSAFASSSLPFFR